MRRRHSYWRVSVSAAACCLWLVGVVSDAAMAVTVYTDRDPKRFSAVLRAFQASTGISVRLVHTQTGLLDQVRTRDPRGPTDVMIAGGLAPLIEAKRAGLTTRIDLPVVEARVPAEYRDPGLHWIGLARYARAVVVAPKRLSWSDATYDDLARPELRGRLCLRSAYHPYNLELIGSKLVQDGRDATKAWLTALKQNLARPPAGNDRAQAMAVVDGHCDIALLNSHYWGELLAAQRDRDRWLQQARLIMPDVPGRGSHVTISGLVLLAGSRAQQDALALVDFLVSPLGQQIYAVLDAAYPVVTDVAASPLAGAALTANRVSLARIADALPELQTLLDEVQFEKHP